MRNFSTKAYYTCIAAACCVLAGSAPLSAATLLAEGFNNVSALPSAGWVLTNNSTPGGTSGWFQGDTSTFSAMNGAANSYLAANYNNAGFGGNVSNWLITPELSLSSGTTLTFYTRTETNAPAPDALDVRLSLNGSSTNVGNTSSSVGDFTTLLLSINSTLNTGGYATDWTKYSVTLNDIAGVVNGRIAFHYAFQDTSTHGDYIGLDSVTVANGAFTNHALSAAEVSTPEPASASLVLLGLGAAACRRFTRKAR